MFLMSYKDRLGTVWSLHFGIGTEMMTDPPDRITNINLIQGPAGRYGLTVLKRLTSTP